MKFMIKGKSIIVLAICHETDLTMKTAKSLIGFISLFAILCNFTSMMVYKWDIDGETRLTDLACYDNTMRVYIVYFLNLVLRFILPTILLTRFNFFIYKKVNDTKFLFINCQILALKKIT